MKQLENLDYNNMHFTGNILRYTTTVPVQKI